MSRKQGPFCYRARPELRWSGKTKCNKAAGQTELSTTWTTPNGIELVGIRRGEHTPDEMVSTVEWLRQCYAHHGGWRDLPAPLAFGEARKEYLADCTFDDEGAESTEAF